MSTFVVEQKNGTRLLRFGRRIGRSLVKSECYKHQREIAKTQALQVDEPGGPTILRVDPAGFTLRDREPALRVVVQTEADTTDGGDVARTGCVVLHLASQSADV